MLCTKVPLVPFTDTVKVPRVAPLEALTVIVVVPVVVRVVGLKVMVTPDGWPVALKVTVELKPPAIVSVTTSVLLAPPCVTVKLVCASDSEKFLTVRVNVVVLVKAPLVPVTVMFEVPPATVAGTTNVKVLAPDPVTDAGLKLAVAFAGNPLTASAVAPVRPGLAVTVMVAVPFVPPAVTVAFPEFDSAKPFATVSVAGMDCTSVPLVPVMLNE